MVNRILLPIICAMILCGGALHALAATSIAGSLIVKDSDPYLEFSPGSEPYKLVGKIAPIVLDLKKLRTGDTLRGTGEIRQKEKIVVLDAIETVGLKQILGSWRTPRWEILEFKDFNRLNLYLRAPPLTATESQNYHSYNYTLAPDTGDNKWSIFIVDESAYHIGKIELDETRIKMQLYNTDTGGAERTILLAPLPPAEKNLNKSR